MKKILWSKTFALAAVAIVTLQIGSAPAFARCGVYNDDDALNAAVNSTLGTITASDDQNNALIQAVADKDVPTATQILLNNGMDSKLMAEHPLVIKGRSPALNSLTFTCTQAHTKNVVDNVYYPGIGWIDIHELWAIFFG